MSTPVLTTKLYIPAPRPNLVPRPHLVERLEQALHLGHRLILVSAPAGFGKTTLVSEWVADHEPLSAWLSLDEDDSEPTRFLTYLVAALQTIAPRLDKGILAVLESSGPPSLEGVLTMLLNELATVQDDFLLVLDDYHLVDAAAIDDSLNFLLDHMPPQMHLLITTREDPQLPLARLRARGQLTELRAAALRFTHDEAAELLNTMTGLKLSAQEVAALETRTEGWIAGLQLAALALQGAPSIHGRENVAAFISAFTGDNRYIVDFLVEEVLQRQPEPIHDFLLHTSILDRLSGSLCDAVRFGMDTTPSGQETGKAMLEALERANLFVVPLDDRRHWYRYHHLFADVLQAHAMEELSERLPDMHRRASAWYAANGSPSDAVRHALAAADFKQAADIIELAWSEMDKSRQSARWLRWARALPDEIVRARPVLCAGFAWALLDSGKLEAAEARLRDAEKWLENRAQNDGTAGERAESMVVVDEEEFRWLPGTLASARAYIALAHGDVQSARRFSGSALAFLSEEDYLRRGIPASLLGLATWRSGHLEPAYQAFAEAMRSFERAGNVLFSITGTYILADIRMAQGRLRDAIGVYEQSLKLALAQGKPLQRGTADLYLGLSELNRQAGELDIAAEQLRKSEGLRKDAALPRWEYRWSLAQAGIKESEGDYEGALECLDKAERLYQRGPVPDVRPVSALKAQVWAKQGRLHEAKRWVVDNGLSAEDELSYVREFEHMTLARVLIAEHAQEARGGTMEKAQDLLERLLHAAEAGGREGSAIKILVLQARAQQAQGDVEAAATCLARALARAEPEGYVGVFRDEGRPLLQLLPAAAGCGVSSKYRERLLAALGGEANGDSAATAPRTQPVVEPLSQRELEVLALLAEGLSNREIGDRLFLALSTVKGHNRNIYGKLQAKRRTEAVARARELGLL